MMVLLPLLLLLLLSAAPLCVVVEDLEHRHQQEGYEGVHRGAHLAHGAGGARQHARRQVVVLRLDAHVPCEYR